MNKLLTSQESAPLLNRTAMYYFRSFASPWQAAPVDGSGWTPGQAIPTVAGSDFS
jgi:hypothetical protein